MKNKNLLSFQLLTAMLISVSVGHAQQSVNATGGDITGTTGSIAYSFGQVVFNTHSGSTGTISQGVQQAFEIFPIGILESEIEISLFAFPNPTMDHLTLQISDFSTQELSYQLFDIQGKLLLRGLVIGEQTQISLSNLSSATYVLNVINSANQGIQSFQILKTK